MAAASASAASCRSLSAASSAVRRSAKLSARGTASAATATSKRTTRMARTRKPMSGVQPKPEPAHRVERKPGELGPDLPDEEVQRSGPANHRGAPDLEHELLAADRLTLSDAEGGENLELGLGQRLQGPGQHHFAALVVDGDGTGDHWTGREGGFAPDAAHASHDGFNPRQQHGFPDRLYQIVVSTGA